MYATTTTMVAATPAAPPPPQPWKEDLFACDAFSCAMGIFCPCVLYGMTQQQIDYQSCFCSCVSYALMGCLVHSSRRRYMRYRYNLRDQCDDCCITMFCPACSLAQEYREVQARGPPPSQAMVLTTPMVAAPMMMSAAPIMVQPAQPQYVMQAQPQVVMQSQPQMVMQGQPQMMMQGQPQMMMQGQPQMIQGQPQMVQGQPQYAQPAPVAYGQQQQQQAPPPQMLPPAAQQQPPQQDQPPPQYPAIDATGQLDNGQVIAVPPPGPSADEVAATNSKLGGDLTQSPDIPTQ